MIKQINNRLILKRLNLDINIHKSYTNRGYMAHKKIITRIKKVKGQVSGIEKMIQEDKDCLEIIQQIKAARAALAKIGGLILSWHSCQIEKKRKPEEFKKIVDELVKSL